MKNTILICIYFFASFAGDLMAQSQEAKSKDKMKAISASDAVKEATYKAYLANKDLNQSKELWKKALALAEQNLKKSPEDKNLQLDHLLTRFGLLSSTMRDKDENLFEEYADDTEAQLETLIDEDSKWGEPKAILSAVYGIKMAYSPWKGMFLGPKSSSLIEKALKQSPSSPLVWKYYGNSKFFTPENFGGDITEAIKAFEKALQLYEADPTAIENNWFYLDTIAFLGQAYTKKGDHARAIGLYEKALQVEPEFGWVKYALLPSATIKK
jgi:tetratricopeptide (TPR) repeat protein